MACFSAGTPIVSLHGSKAIEDFKSYEDHGEECDWVWSRDEFDADSEPRLRRVLRTFVRESLVLNLHVGGKVIGTTHEHPFYAKGKGWTNAHELRIGDEIRLMDAGWTKVEGIADAGQQTVYNLEIEDDHTYFVGDLTWGWQVWAHNTVGCDVAHNATRFSRFKELLKFYQTTGYTRISRSAVEFRGMVVRGVRDLSHLTEGQLRFGLKNGNAPRAPGRGDNLVLHHHRQQVHGPIIEIPQRLHTNGNRLQHPLGNTGGIGNGPQRTDFNSWRDAFWKHRCNRSRGQMTIFKDFLRICC